MSFFPRLSLFAGISLASINSFEYVGFHEKLKSRDSSDNRLVHIYSKESGKYLAFEENGTVRCGGLEFQVAQDELLSSLDERCIAQSFHETSPVISSEEVATVYLGNITPVQEEDEEEGSFVYGLECNFASYKVSFFMRSTDKFDSIKFRFADKSTGFIKKSDLLSDFVAKENQKKKNEDQASKSSLFFTLKKSEDQQISFCNQLNLVLLNENFIGRHFTI
jgi:hypothetical protein